jgi:hypothetical protein
MKETRKDVYLRNDSRYHNHETRPDLAGEHLKGDTYQLIAFFYFHWINRACCTNLTICAISRI